AVKLARLGKISGCDLADPDTLPSVTNHSERAQPTAGLSKIGGLSTPRHSLCSGQEGAASRTVSVPLAEPQFSGILGTMQPNQMGMFGALVDVSSRIRQDCWIGEVLAEILILGAEQASLAHDGEGENMEVVGLTYSSSPQFLLL